MVVEKKKKKAQCPGGKERIHVSNVSRWATPLQGEIEKKKETGESATGERRGRGGDIKNKEGAFALHLDGERGEKEKKKEELKDP